MTGYARIDCGHAPIASVSARNAYALFAPSFGGNGGRNSLLCVKVRETHTNSDIPVIPPIFDWRAWTLISPVFPYEFRRSQCAPENGRAEQSGTDLEVEGKSARLGELSTQR